MVKWAGGDNFCFLLLPGYMLYLFSCCQVYESSKGKEEADKVANYFGPAVEHLGKWMPLYLAPPLIVLPNALSEVRGCGRGSLASVCCALVS